MRPCGLFVPVMAILFILCLPDLTHAAVNLGSGAWDDLTNNFATDIAPLIALFGEQVTKQFLSESTYLLDNIIFGMAPLGILTAVVSAIRVYGWPSMKAFIGRAQEPHGIAEAELCSSTSHDVCELWSEGGICRVFGRPRVLEFFFKPGRNDFLPKFSKSTTERQVEEPGACNLYRPVCFLSGCRCPKSLGCGEKDSDWEEVDPVAPANSPTSGEDSQTMDFAPCPNMSLNIGIRVAPLWGQIIIAALVSLLQLGFFAFAALITFDSPDLYAEGEEPAVWPFVLAVLGTAMLVSGMILCAFLIERRSRERHFVEKRDATTRKSFGEAFFTTSWMLMRHHRSTRKNGAPLDTRSAIHPKRDTVMYWLQPGDQLIGDQQFSGFSYNKTKHKYVTSLKTDLGQDQLRPHYINFVLLLALFASIIGFILQFIGLRSLHGSIALYQITATLLAAVVRALLRQRRLTPEDNKLRSLGARFVGHELDWQAIDVFINHLSWVRETEECSSTNSRENRVREVSSWRVSDEPDQTPGPLPYTGNQSVIRIASRAKETDVYCLHGFFSDVGDPGMLTMSWSDAEPSASQAIEFVRHCESAVAENPPNWVATIAHLRSRLAYITSDGMNGVQPKWDGPLRSVAQELQLAIQGLANYTLSGKVPLKNIAGHGKKGAWQDVSALVWHTTATISYTNSVGFSGEKIEVISLPMFRFEGEWKISKYKLEAILSLWASSRGQSGAPDDLNDKVLLGNEAGQRAMLSTLNLWVPAGNLKPWKTRAFSKQHSWTEAWVVEDRRILLRSASPDAAELDDWNLIAMRTKSPWIRLLAQHVFTMFFSRLADIIHKIEISEEDLLSAWGLRNAEIPTATPAVIGTPEEFRGLTNKHVDFMTKLFVQSGLGTEEEALMCIIPVLVQTEVLPGECDILKKLVRWALKLRRQTRFQAAEATLKVVLDSRNPNITKESIEGLGEVYRKAYKTGQREWALNGFAKLSQLGGFWVTEHGQREGSDSRPSERGWTFHRRFSEGETAVFRRYWELSGFLREYGQPNLETLESRLLSTPRGSVDVLAVATKTDLAVLDEAGVRTLLQRAIEAGCTELVEDILEMHEELLGSATDFGEEISKKLTEIRADSPVVS